MNTAHHQLGIQIRNHRQLQKMTQLELALKLGYETPQFVSLFERGMSKIPLETLGQLIVILKIPEKKVLKVLIEGFAEETAEKLRMGKKQARG